MIDRKTARVGSARAPGSFDSISRFIKWQKAVVVRGGRVTKYKGTTASYSPQMGLLGLVPSGGDASSVSPLALARNLLRWSVAPAALLATASPAMAQDTCVEVTPGNWTCQDNGGSATTTQTIAGIEAPTVGIEDGFGIDVNGFTGLVVVSDKGAALSQISGSSSIASTNTGVDIQLVGTGSGLFDFSSTSITGGSVGIQASNGANGLLTLSTGDVTGGTAILATATLSGSQGGLKIDTTAGTLNGVSYGVHATSDSGTVSITTADINTTGLSGAAIYAQNSGGDLTIDTSAGAVVSSGRGIIAYHSGSGDLSIVTADVTNDSGYGVGVTNLAGDVTVDTSAGAVDSGNTGISVNNYGGSVHITTGYVRGRGDAGIVVYNGASGGDVVVESSGGVFGVTYGIAVTNVGNGTTSLTVDAVSGGRGIVTRAYTGATTITLDSTSVINGTSGAAIDASSLGGAITIQGQPGVNLVYGATDGILVSSSGGDIGIDALKLVQGNAGDALDLRSGGGAITVNAVGTLQGIGGNAISADSDGGDITITGSGLIGGIQSTTGAGILADASGPGGTGGDILISGNGAIEALTYGIRAVTAGSGSVTISASDTIRAYVDPTSVGISAVAADGSISLLGNGNGILGGASAIAASSTGGDISVSGFGFVVGDKGNGFTLTSTTGDIDVSDNLVTIGENKGVSAITDSGDIRIVGTSLRTAFVGVYEEAIYARTTSGSVTITGTGDVQSLYGTGINVANASSAAGAITIDTSGSKVTAGGDGIVAGNFGNATMSITTGAVEAGKNGLFAYARGGDLIIDTTGGSVSGASGAGILANVQYAGDITITTGNLTGGYVGMLVRDYYSDNDVALDTSAGTVSGGYFGVAFVGRTINTGLTITTADVTAKTQDAILVSIDDRVGTSSSGSITVDSSAGTLTAGRNGIYVSTEAADNISLDVTVGSINAQTGILATNVGKTTITLAAGAVVNASTGNGVEVLTNGSDFTLNGAAGSQVIGGNTGLSVQTGGGNIAVDSVDLIQGNGFDGLNLNSGGGAVSVSDIGTVTGARDGISITNAGDIEVTGSGLVGGISGASGIGIYAASTGGSITITGNGDISGSTAGIIAANARHASTSGPITVDTTTGSVTAASTGIQVINNGSEAVSVTTADVTATNGFGIYVRNTGADLAIDTSAGTVSATLVGIVASNQGNGALSITSADISTPAGFGIYALHSGTDLSIDTSAGSITAARSGIVARNNGSGALSITTGNVSADATDSVGIYAQNVGSQLSIDTTAGAIKAENIGIWAINFGSGTLTITTGDINTSTGAGIYANNFGADVTIDTTAGSIAAQSGIVAINRRSGALSVTTADVTGASVFGIYARNAGTSLSIDTTAGSVSGGQSGIFAINEGSGALTITTADVTGGPTYGYGIYALNKGTGLAIDTSAGSVSSGNTGIYASNKGSGALAITTADVTGAGPSGINAVNYSSGDFSIDTTAGDVLGGQTGISAISAGLSSLTITTGDVTGTTGTGIFAATASTDLTIDSTAGSVSGGLRGIFASALGGGAVTINANIVTGGTGIFAVVAGGPTTISLSSSAVITGTNWTGITVSSAGGAITVQGHSGSVYGATDGIFLRSLGGEITIDNLDLVQGDAGDGLDLGSGGGALTVNAVDTVLGTGGSGILAVSGGGDIAVTGNGLVGGVVGTAGAGIAADASGGTGGSIGISGNGVVTGSVAGIWAVTDGAGTISVDLSATTSGGNYGVAVANAGGAVTIDNSALLTGGQFAVYAADPATGAITFTNSGTVGSAVQFADGDDSFGNSGTFIAAGTSDFGGGTDALTNSGVLSVDTSATFTGLERLSNSGLITMTNGATGNSLTTSGDFVGTGGTLAVDVDFAAGTADRFIIGGAATGTTNVGLNVVDSSAALGQPILLVDAGSGTSANAFVLPGGQQDVTPFVAYVLHYDATNYDFLLTQALTPRVFAATKIGESAQSLWYRSADAWGDHRAASRFSGGSQPLWMSFYGQVAKRDQTFADPTGLATGGAVLDYRQDYFGIQGGLDLARGDRLGFGLTGGYLSSQMNLAAYGVRARFDTFNIGAAASYEQGGFFAEALLKYDVISGKLQDNAQGGYAGDLSGDAYGARLQLGYRIEARAVTLEPHGSIEYQRTSLDDLPLGAQSFSFDAMDGLRGKAGLRISSTGDPSAPRSITYFLDASVVHEFAGTNTTRFVYGSDTVGIDNKPIDTYAHGELGVRIGGTGPVSGFFQAEGDVSGGYTSFGGKVGVQLAF